MNKTRGPIIPKSICFELLLKQGSKPPMCSLHVKQSYLSCTLVISHTKMKASVDPMPGELIKNCISFSFTEHFGFQFGVKIRLREVL